MKFIFQSNKKFKLTFFNQNFIFMKKVCIFAKKLQ